jgi:AcrR family transcriptional regulator
MAEGMTPQQRAAETKRRRTREWIIQSTIDLYGGQASGDYTREQIAEAAGVGLTTLSNHFRLKYEILKAAHDRVIAPITEPIREGDANGTYNPQDGIDELIRYVYSVTKMCHEHNALTIAMVRAYFEPTEYSHLNLADTIAHSMRLILKTPPFSINMFNRSPHGVRVGSVDPVYHSRALLLELYHDHSDGAAKNVCHQFLAAALMDFDIQDIAKRQEDIQERVDTWFERRRSLEM